MIHAALLRHRSNARCSEGLVDELCGGTVVSGLEDGLAKDVSRD